MVDGEAVLSQNRCNLLEDVQDKFGDSSSGASTADGCLGLGEGRCDNEVQIDAAVDERSVNVGDASVGRFVQYKTRNEAREMRNARRAVNVGTHCLHPDDEVRRALTGPPRSCLTCSSRDERASTSLGRAICSMIARSGSCRLLLEQRDALLVSCSHSRRRSDTSACRVARLDAKRESIECRVMMAKEEGGVSRVRLMKDAALYTVQSHNQEVCFFLHRQRESTRVQGRSEDEAVHL